MQHGLFTDWGTKEATLKILLSKENDNGWCLKNRWKRFIRSHLVPISLRKYTAAILLQGSMCSSVDMITCISFTSFVCIILLCMGKSNILNTSQSIWKPNFQVVFGASCKSILSQKTILLSINYLRFQSIMAC